MEIENLLKAHREFFLSQRTKELDFRISQLKKLEELLRKHEDELYRAIERDFGKSVFETYATEIGFIYQEIKLFLKKLPEWSHPQKIRTGLSNLPGKSRIHHEPLGCCLIIGAWNYPFQLTLLPAIAALAAGNTVVLKPSELAPECSALLGRLINNSFPREYFHVVEGPADATTALLKHRFDHVFFTGSPRVGRIVYEAAARHLTPVTLELGGKSPAIVCPSADLKVVARRIVWGKFINGGQTCIAPDYLLIHESLKDSFPELLKEQIRQFDYQAGSEQYTRIINQRHYDRLTSLIDPDKVYLGGASQNIESEKYIAPTVLTNVEWEDACMQEEIFGPILPVISFGDYDELLSRLIRLEKPLAAYLFSNDRMEQKKFTEQLSFGGGCINDTLMHVSNVRLPFGGVGNSGTGHYHGHFGFKTFSHAKAILHKANWGEPSIKYPPYSEGKMKWVRRLLSGRP